jgi:hypothetical protein
MKNKFLWTSVLTLTLIASGFLLNTGSDAATAGKPSKALTQVPAAHAPKAAAVSKSLSDTSGSGWICCNIYCLDGTGSRSGDTTQCSIPGIDLGQNSQNCQDTCKHYCGVAGCDLTNTNAYVFSNTQNCGVEPQPSYCNNIPICANLNN